MSKIGVGVGEDFPVDEKPQPNPQSPGDDGYADYAARREAYRKWRMQRREWKRRWHDEWHARRREFRDELRGAYYGRYGARPMGHPFYWGDGRQMWRILAIVGAIALVVFAFSHIYFILGGIVVLALCATAYRHGFDPFDLPPREWRDAPHGEQAPPRPDAPPAETPKPSEH